MSRIGKRGIVGLTLLGTALVAFLVVQVLRVQTSPQPAQPPPSEEMASKQKTQEALRDASLLDLIRNARVATRKGDDVTRTAMVNGLKKEPARAKALIQREIAKSKDATDQVILTRIGSELP